METPQLAVMATRLLIPNMASDMKERIRREAYLTSEIMIRMDLLRATGQGRDSIEKKFSLSFRLKFFWLEIPYNEASCLQ